MMGNILHRKQNQEDETHLKLWAKKVSGEGEDTSSRSNLGQFQSVIRKKKFEMGSMALQSLYRVLLVYKA